MHPLSFLVCLDPCAQAFPVARPVTPNHGEKLIPVDHTEIVVAAFLVPLQIGIGNRQFQIIRLRDGLARLFAPFL